MLLITPEHGFRGWALLLAIVTALVPTVGCKRHAAATGSPTGSQDPSIRAAGIPEDPAASNGVVIADSGDMSVTLHQLSLELRRYVIRTRSVPRTFEEFASKSQVRYPPPPAGKKYAIQNQEVVLVNS